MKQATDITLILLFAGAIVAFGLGTFLAPKQAISTTEKRQLAGLPKLRFKHLSDFTADFEAFASDRMPMRTELVQARNLLKYKAWGTSGSPSVLAGKDGWLYFLGDNSAFVFRHEKPYSENELQQWKRALEQRTAGLAQRGMKYMFVVAPDKPTIYPEYLPAGFGPVSSQSRLDQLTAYLKDDSRITFVNLADTLRANRGSEPLYWKTDTHWNYLGAFIGYRQIMNVVATWFPMVAPVAESQVHFVDEQFSSGDCASLMGLLGILAERAPQAHQSGRVSSGEKAPRVLVLHDSFGNGLKPFFSMTFPNIVWHHQTDAALDEDVIAAAKPDLVIQELVERKAAAAPPVIDQDDWRHWVTQTIVQQGKGGFINILPMTTDINVVNLSNYKKLSEAQVLPTTSRKWDPAGDQVSFEPKQAGYSRWYLLKTGDQGAGFIDAASEQAYNDLQTFVKTSGKYGLCSEFKLTDGSKLLLYKHI